MSDPAATPDLPADEADRLDARLETLLATARPDAGLEDRVIAALKAAPAARPARPMSWPKSLALTAAGLGLLAAVGAIFSGGRMAGPADSVFTAMADRVPPPMAAGGTLTRDEESAPDEKRLTKAQAKYAKGEAMSKRMRAEFEGSSGSGGQLSAREALDRQDPNFQAALAAPPAPPATSPGGLGGGLGGGGLGGLGGGGLGGGLGGGGLGGNPPPPAISYSANWDALKDATGPNARPSLNYFRPGEQAAGEGSKNAPKPAADPDGVKAEGNKDGRANPSDATPPAAGEPKADPKGPRPAADPVPPQRTEPGPQPVRRVVIRSGEIEFEVSSFDGALAAVTKLVTAIPGAYVGTVNQDKMPNGKVRGTVAVRVPPEALDGLVLDLRRELGKDGELKGIKLTSADVTKQYTDLESRLRAARTMEQRLIQIIKEGKGEIKQLLEAERELGTWRTKIEEAEGELRYYANLAALSTLTLTLTEREARAAAVFTDTERVQAGVEVDDVDKAYQAMLAAVVDAKGRVLKSEVKQLSAGQYSASLQFEVPPEASGPARDRLRQLGRVARLEIDRLTQAEGAAGPVPKDAKPRRGDTLFLLQLYNLANVAPRETALVTVAAPDVPAAYQALRDAVAKGNGRVLNAHLNEQDRQNVTAQVDFEVRRADEPAVRAALEAAGEVVARQVGRAPESDNVTDTKVLYRTSLLSAGRLPPREQTTLTVEVEDVDATAGVFTGLVVGKQGRALDAKTSREPSGKASARLVYEVPLAAAGELERQFKAAGQVRAYYTNRDPQGPSGRLATARLDVTLAAPERIVGADEGVWPPVRKGLSYSLSVLLTSLTWVVFGLCVVLPWAVAVFAGYRLVRWAAKASAAPAPPPAPPPAPAAPAE